MPLYTVQAVIQRPTYVYLSIEADSITLAEARASSLLEENVGLKHIQTFPELIGESEGTYDDISILDVEQA